MARRRKMSRRTRTALFVVGTGVALGLGAVFVLPWLRRRQQQPTITIPEDEISVSRATIAQGDSNYVDSYDPSQPINEGALSFLTPEQRMALEWGT